MTDHPVFNDLVRRAQVKDVLGTVEAFKLDWREPGIESLLVEPAFEGVDNAAPNVSF